MIYNLKVQFLQSSIEEKGKHILIYLPSISFENS
jgi:hypothetical protein